MAKEVVTFTVQGGEIVSPGAGWVYVWCEADADKRPVIYVGATALNPIARAEKHLRDPDPLVGRVRARYTAAGGDIAQPLTVRAVEVGAGGRRALVKQKVAWVASASRLLSARYCGEAPALPGDALTPEEEECVAALLGSLT